MSGSRLADVALSKSQNTALTKRLQNQPNELKGPLSRTYVANPKNMEVRDINAASFTA